MIWLAHCQYNPSWHVVFQFYLIVISRGRHWDLSHNPKLGSIFKILGLGSNSENSGIGIRIEFENFWDWTLFFLSLGLGLGFLCRPLVFFLQTYSNFIHDFNINLLREKSVKDLKTSSLIGRLVFAKWRCRALRI